MSEIVCVGHNCLDYICTIEAYPPEDGSTHITSIEDHGGGAASTAAVAAARLGVSVAIVGHMGDDKAGKIILRRLKDSGVATDLIRVLPETRSPVSYIMVNPANGLRTKFPCIDRLAPIAWDDDQVRAVRAAKILHLDGTRYDNAMAAARIARESGVTVSLDGCHIEKDLNLCRDLVRMTDILIMDARYPMVVSGENNFESALLEMAGWGPRIVVGTQGVNGYAAVINGQVRRFPAFRVDAIDTTGAGDVFHGAFLAAWLRNSQEQDHERHLESALRVAAATAAMKCTRPGGCSGVLTWEQVQNFMASYHD